MKKLILIVMGLAGLALLSGCPAKPNANKSAENVDKSATNTTEKTKKDEKADNLKAYDDSSISDDARIKEIDEYAINIDKHLPKDKVKESDVAFDVEEIDVSKQTFEDFIIEGNWDSIYRYTDKGDLKKIKVVSDENVNNAESYYFYKDKLIFAFIQDDATAKVTDGGGDKYYYGSKGLFAIIEADGTRVDIKSEKFKNAFENLPKKAEAFKGVKKAETK